MIPGIDVSENNGVINWKAIATVGHRFSFIKAVEGATYHDKQFVTNYAQAAEHGIYRGAYGFARPKTSSAIDEANALVDIVEANGGFQLPPMLDMEDAGGLTAPELVAWCRVWASVVTERTNRKPILYAGSSFIKRYSLHVLSNQFDLFVAHYGVDSPDIGGFTTWKFWQKEQDGTVPGANGNFDIDVFNGSISDLQTLCGIPHPSTPVATPKYRVVLSDTFTDIDQASLAAMNVSKIGYAATVEEG